jgi:hypothetical protein
LLSPLICQLCRQTKVIQVKAIIAPHLQAFACYSQIVLKLLEHQLHPAGLMPHALMALPSWPHALMALPSWPHALMASCPHGLALMASCPHGLALMASSPHGLALKASCPHGLMPSWPCPHGLMPSWPHTRKDQRTIAENVFCSWRTSLPSYLSTSQVVFKPML